MKLTSNEIREKYLKFFEKRGHKIISPAPLVLEGDPTTLFTSAGMQPLIPYLKGEPHPDGKRLVDSQPSLRLQDIEEVGDNRHTTFFEMLGNWSLGDYFKKEQLGLIFEFFTKELGIAKEALWVSVFEGLPAQPGTKEVPRDEESYNRWLELGIAKEKIHFYGVDKNWWSRSGAPDKMPAGEIGGPDSEIFYDFDPDGKLGVHNKSKYKDQPCHPNCDCGRFLEIGNSVFIQYEKQKDGSLKELPQKNVDFGGGLERIAAVLNEDPDIFKIDLFLPVVRELESRLGVKYGSSRKITESLRTIAEHLRASVFLIANGVRPENKLQGYILRRLLRRAAFKAYLIKRGFDSKDFKSSVKAIVGVYTNYFKKSEHKKIEEEVGLEVRKFRSTIERGFKEIEKLRLITGKNAFDLYQSFGFPLELTEEIAKERGQKVDKEVFEKEFEKHKQASRTASAGMFKGGLAESGEEVTKLHTTTHLLHAALRKVLGEHVAQKGSNITAQRLRFDFSHPQKLTDEEIIKVEKLINDAIDKSLPVSFETKSLDAAIKEGALHFFAEKYGEKVKVYTVGSSTGSGIPFSMEICGGPHVTNTNQIGRVRIIKQEKVGAGIMRIYATNK